MQSYHVRAVTEPTSHYRDLGNMFTRICDPILTEEGNNRRNIFKMFFD